MIVAWGSRSIVPMHPPANGSEADDWRIRALAELLVQAIATDDAALVRAVDDAATACRPARSRFVERLHTLRRHIGPEPRGYPAARTARPAGC
jgi:hypothetical protein